MLIQKQIEAKVLSILRTAFTTADVDYVTCGGAWETAQAGLVKWVQDCPTPAFVNVSVGNPGWRTFSTPVVDLAVNISLFIRTELDEDGSKLSAVAGIIEDTIRGWMTATYQQQFTALDVENMSVDGLSIGAGNSPTVSDGNCVVSWPLTFNGSYIESATDNNN